MIFFMQECEDKIGYTFRDKELLRLCFTHSSYSHEHGGGKDNERLEFFGDSVLGFVTAEYLMAKYPGDDEGRLTEYKQKLVSRKPLADAIEKAGLGEHILFGEGESRNGEEHHEAARENLFEAIVAGIYYDGGLEQAKKFIYDKLFSLHESEPRGKSPKKGGAPDDPKSRLQEYVQKKKLGELFYREISRSGPDHEPVFVIAAELDGKRIGEGKGKSKSEASRQAAENALSGFERKSDLPDLKGKSDLPEPPPFRSVKKSGKQETGKLRGEVPADKPAPKGNGRKNKGQNDTRSARGGNAAGKAEHSKRQNGASGKKEGTIPGGARGNRAERPAGRKRDPRRKARKELTGEF